MKNENTKKFLDLVSKKDSGWLAKAQWREDNEDWLDISFSIAVKILSALSANKKSDSTLPKNQKELAEAMGCSAQYVNKLLRGEENLQIETICKIQRILDIKLIEVPKADITKTVRFEPTSFWLDQFNIKTTTTTTTSYYNDSKVAKYKEDEIYEPEV